MVARGGEHGDRQHEHVAAIPQRVHGVAVAVGVAHGLVAIAEDRVPPERDEPEDLRGAGVEAAVAEPPSQDDGRGHRAEPLGEAHRGIHVEQVIEVRRPQRHVDRLHPGERQEPVIAAHLAHGLAEQGLDVGRGSATGLRPGAGRRRTAPRSANGRAVPGAEARCGAATRSSSRIWGTVRAIGPCPFIDLSDPGGDGKSPTIGQVSDESRRPSTPQYAAGQRMLPPMSLPQSNDDIPSATAAAAPPELPPVVREGS